MGLKMLGARSVASPVGPENQKKGDKKKERGFSALLVRWSDWTGQKPSQNRKNMKNRKIK